LAADGDRCDPPHDHRTTLQGAVAGLGGAIAISGMEWFSRAALTIRVLVVGSIPAKGHPVKGASL